MIKRTTYHISRIVLLLTVFAEPFIGNAQTTIVQDAPKINGTTVVIPGKEYNRSGYHNFFWGKHYRKEWNTASRFPDFYIDTAMGGLTPVSKGGGRQSTSLRLKDKNGSEYVLRSINKNLATFTANKYLLNFYALRK